MLATAAIAHSARGRTRYKVTARRRDAGYFVSVEQQLSKVSEVASVEVNPLTGSVLVHHHCSVEALNAYAEKGELFQVSTLPEGSLDLLRQRSSFLDRQLQHLTGRFFDLRSLTLVLLLSIGMVQLLRGQFAGPALTMFWYAASLCGRSDQNSGSA
jgi:Heavy metal associated domain 2